MAYDQNAADLLRENRQLRDALTNLLDTSAVTESDEDFTTIQCVNKHYEAAYDALKANTEQQPRR